MNNMLLALEITALGMGLVFAAIVLLWWVMSLLTAITAESDATSKRNLVLTFGGGVNEVQRELVAMFGLGLQKVPR